MTRKTAEHPAAVISFTVPLVPPSVNHYKMRTRKGVTFVSREAKNYKKAVAIFGRGLSIRAKAYEATISIFLGKNGRGDPDNFSKCVLDGLVESGIIHSDAHCKITTDTFRDWERPRTEIVVRAR